MFASNDKMPSYQQLAEQSKIPRSTISDWHQRFKENPEWRPYNQNISCNRRVLDDSNEAEIKQMLEVEYIEKERLLTFDIVKTVICAHVFTDKEPHSDGTLTAPCPNLNFKCSRHYLDNFLHRNGLSNRVCTATRRPQIDPNEVERF